MYTLLVTKKSRKARENKKKEKPEAPTSQLNNEVNRRVKEQWLEREY